MLAFLLATLLAVAGESASALESPELDGTWKYSGPDGGLQVRLKRGGGCELFGGRATGPAYFHQCTYESHGPNVDIQLKPGKDGVWPEPLRLVLVAWGELLRVEGEARRPLRRVWDLPAPIPAPIDLDKPGAMAELEKEDPEGHRKVVEMMEIVTTHGCQGAFLGVIKELLHPHLTGCGSMDDPPKSIFMFWLGEKNYKVTVQTKRD